MRTVFETNIFLRNITTVQQISHIEPDDTPLKVDESRPSKEEVKRAIRHLKNRKAAGPDGIPPEAIKADLETSAEMLYNLGKK